MKHGFPPHYKKGNVNCVVNDDEDQSDDDSISVASHKSTSSNFCFTPDRHRALLALLQDMNKSHSINQITSMPMSTPSILSPAPGSSHAWSSGIVCNVTSCSKSYDWILDTGATNHICHSLSKFHSHRRVKPVLVKLPNGSRIITQYSGTVYFSEHLYLNDVLYIPSYHFNLISVSQLVSSLKCELTFSNVSCHIQDIMSSRMIGATDLQQGLYVLKDSSSCFSSIHVANNFCSYNPDMWHLRFGHTSYEKLACLQNLYFLSSLIKLILFLVMCAIYQNRKSFLFLLAIVSLSNYLILFMLIFGDHYPFHQFLDIDIS